MHQPLCRTLKPAEIGIRNIWTNSKTSLYIVLLTGVFDELLARIRDIRASEKRFYQKVRDLFALSSDYDKTDKATQMFFAEAQNKLLYAVTHQTAAELIVARADANQPNMGLTTWKGSIVRKGDPLFFILLSPKKDTNR